jgi:hypothetical protein
VKFRQHGKYHTPQPALSFIFDFIAKEVVASTCALQDALHE